MFLRLNQLSVKQKIFVQCFQIAKQFLPHSWYLIFIKLISYISKSPIKKKIYSLCPPSMLPEIAAICYKIKNLLSLSR